MYRGCTLTTLATFVFLPLLNARLSNEYQHWIDQDVYYIITPSEHAEYLTLSTDKQRDQFIEAFWSGRDPTPDTPENEFKEEHYRRIAFANEHFADRLPGWKTDRGRAYIVYGPPDKIDSFGSTATPQQSSAFARSPYPYQIWHYRRMNGRSKGLTIRFVDTCLCGDYRQQQEPVKNQDIPLLQ